MKPAPQALPRLRWLCCSAACLLPLAASADVAPAENKATLVELTSSYTREYLSDPRRAGSLVGSILGGALTAHPAGSMIGGVLGFLVGKATMIEDEDQRANLRHASVTRPIISADGHIPTLSFSQGKGFEPDPAATANDLADGDRPPWPAAENTAPSLAAFSPQQLAGLCNDAAHVRQLEGKLRMLCYYRSSTY